MDLQTSLPDALQAPVQATWGSLLLPHSRASVPPARWAVIDALRERPDGQIVTDEVLTDVAIVVSELLGNAVRHAAALPGGDVLVRWHVDAASVQIEVVDGGGGPLDLGRPGPYATGGRGLDIIDQLSSRWGSWVDDLGRRTVWADLPRVPVGVGALAVSSRQPA